MGFPTALTSGQYDKLQGTSLVNPSYWASEFVVFGSNVQVMTARVNGATTGTSYAQITYDGAAGAYADIQANSLILISATNDPRAAYFVGRARLDENTGIVANATIINLNESSIPIADNDYIFAIRDFRLFDRLSRQVGLTQYSDWNIGYRLPAPYITGIQSAYANVVSGSPEGYTIAFTPTGNPIASGATINNSTWHWIVPTDTGTATFTVGSNTSQNPTIRFGAGYSDWVTVYVADDTTFSGFFHFYVAAVSSDYSDVIAPYVANVSLTLNENGWDGTLDAFSGVDELIDNTLCIVFDIETYNGTQASLMNNVRFVGRIRKENNQTTADETYNQLQQASYELEGLIAQFSRVEHLPFTLRNDDTPTVFDEMLNLSIWRGIAYTLYWRSTFLELFATSFDSTDNTFLYPLLPTQGGNIFAIIKELATNINAVIQAAPTGEVQIARDANFLTTAQRNALTTVADFDNHDYIDFTLEITEVDSTGKVQAYGGYYNYLSGNVIALASIAPGLAQGIGEGISTFSRNVLATTVSQDDAQAELDSRSGNQYEIVRRPETLLIVTMPDGYDFLTAAVNQWYTWTIAASENTGGRVFTTAERWQCVAGSQTHDFGAGTKAIQYTFKLESQGTPGTKPPDVPPDGVQPSLPVTPPLPAFPSLPPLPGIYLPTTPVPGDLPPYVSPVTLSNGNLIALISDIQQWITPNALTTSRPTYKEGTPDPTLEYTCFQWVGLGSKGAYLLGNDGTDSTLYYSEDATGANPVWTPTALTGVYTVIRVGSTAGVVWCQGVITSSVGCADDWEIRAGDGTETSRTSDSISASSTFSGGVDRVIISATGYGTGPTPPTSVCRNAVVVGSGTAFVAGWFEDGDAYPSGERFGIFGSNKCVWWMDIQDTAPFTVTVTLSAGVSCGDCTDTALLSIYSTDYGATFASPETIAATGGGFDTVKVGAVALAGATGQVMKATSGGAWAAYGSALPDAASVPTCIWIPYYAIGSNSTKNSSTNPDYVVAFSALDSATESMYLVTSSGTVFNAITPVVSTVKGLAVSENCFSMPFKSGTRLAAVLDFSGTRKVVVSSTIGSSDTFTSRGAVANGAQSIRFLKSDGTFKALCIGNGATGLLVSQNNGVTLLSKGNPGADAVLLAEFFG